MAATLPDQLALRIGMAARALPQDGIRPLMEVLVDVLGLPLTEEKLARLSIRELRVGAGGLLSGRPRASLHRALGYLRGIVPVQVEDTPPPTIELYRDGEMPYSVRLAVASDSGEAIDGGFGGCANFLIYQVSPTEIRLIDRRQPRPAANKSSRDALRTALLEDCQLLYARSIGNPATARLMRAGIHPVRQPDGGNARNVLGSLQAVLARRPPRWLARAMHV